MSRNAGLVRAWLVVVLACLASGGEALQAAALPGLVSWWPGEGTANDLAGTNNGTLLGGATASVAGRIGQAFGFDGNDDLVQIPDSPQLKPDTLTIEAWVLFSALDSAGSGGSPPGQQFIVFKQSTTCTRQARLAEECLNSGDLSLRTNTIQVSLDERING